MTALAARLARPEILALEPFDVGTRTGDYGPDSIRLDANENPFPPLVQDNLAVGLNRYPEPQPARLRDMMAALYEVPADYLLLTRGGDDAIDVLVRAFCRPTVDSVAVCLPTFSAYAHFARLQGARVIEARLDPEFDFDAESLLDSVRDDPGLKLVFICSPNNPTGNRVDRDQILKVVEELPQSLVVVDEAYLEFADSASLAGEVVRRPNLVVLKTLSKAFGLAGARVGALIANPELVAIAARALPPYPLPTPSIEAALAALAPSRRPVHEERISRIKAERERVALRLERSPIVRRVRTGGGNFLFLEVDQPDRLATSLRANGIQVRFRPNAAPGGVRLTIGSEAENELALRAFGVAEGLQPGRQAEVVRDTRETRIACAVDLDRASPRRIDTGIAFYDHMLDQVAAHGGFSLVLACEGDVEIDLHHSLEDVAIAFGQALSKALGDRRGIGRFGFSLPMDEAEAHVLVDLSGRPFSRFDGAFGSSRLGDYPTEMTSHVFRSLADSLGAAIHVRVSGENDHHKTEACFKAFGRALRQALARQGDDLPSTKGSL